MCIHYVKASRTTYTWMYPKGYMVMDTIVSTCETFTWTSHDETTIQLRSQLARYLHGCGEGVMTDRAILEMSCNHWFQVHSFSWTHSARHVSAPCFKSKFHKTSLQSSCGGKYCLDDVQMGCQSTVMLPAYKGYFCEPHVLMLSTYNCLLQTGGFQSESRLSSEVRKTVKCNCWSSVAASRWCNNDPTLWSIQQSCKFLQVHKTSGIVGFTGSVWHHCHRIPWEHYWGLSPEWFKGPTSLEGSIN
jgi:hypothetical protein